VSGFTPIHMTLWLESTH